MSRRYTACWPVVGTYRPDEARATARQDLAVMLRAAGLRAAGGICWREVDATEQHAALWPELTDRPRMVLVGEVPVVAREVPCAT